MIIEKLTEAEEIVMKAVWDAEKEAVLSDVADRVNDFYGRNWKRQTVSTFLSKLVRKNYLKLQRNGKVYTYKILIPEAEYRKKLYSHHISFWNHNNAQELVIEMIQNGDLKKEKLAELIERK